MSVRELRDKMGLSQSKFGAYFGIPVANIQRWEQGLAKPPEYVVTMMSRIVELEHRVCVLQQRGSGE